ncbi:MAG: hypothetical protein MO846_10205 [Candidatus Devosia symbiotica]|nr:hypothetical protein [Candidatus Devosia symbiotica]
MEKGLETSPFLCVEGRYIGGASGAANFQAYVSQITRLVSRFHLLFLAVTLAATAVALFRIPVDFVYAAHQSGSTADWLWIRNTALAVSLLLALALLLLFFGIGRLLSKNQFAKSHHILDPASTRLLAVIAATQFGLLLTGVGSHIDVIRLTGFGLDLVLVGAGRCVARCRAPHLCRLAHALADRK